MLVDLTIIPLRGGRHISDEVTEVIKLIDASGLPISSRHPARASRENGTL